MIVIGTDQLQAWWSRHPQAENPLRAFVALARRCGADTLREHFAALLREDDTGRLVFALPGGVAIEARLHAPLGILRIEAVTVTPATRTKG